MIPGTVGARHPRPKPNEKICCTSGRSLTMTSGRSLTIAGVLRFSARFWARVARPYDVWIIH